MSAAHQRLQIAQLCGRNETLKDATDLLNVALSKTGPGSGHDLGKNATALPAICAFLASERLGNNDVVKKVAQDVSCLKPKDFEAALSTVRGALSGYLSRKHGKVVSYEVLCRTHGLNGDCLYWMGEVDKALRKSGELRELEVNDETILYMVFYWTCIALNIRSVKQATIISDYEVPLHAFQDLEYILDKTCDNLKESMSKFISDARTARTTVPTPTKGSGRSPQKLPGCATPSKERAGVSGIPISSQMKTPTKSMPDGSPSKRKAVLPPLPFMTPTKKQKTTSPVKLNRIPVTSSLFTPPKNRAGDDVFTASPAKRYGRARSFFDSPQTPAAPKQAEEPEITRAYGKIQADDDDELEETPVTPVKSRRGRQEMVEFSTPDTPSPRKSARLQPSVAGPSTPMHRRTRSHIKRTADSDVEMEDLQAEASSESSDDEETEPPPCRHYVPVFADRLFYHYRDPRVMREWEACEQYMKSLALGQGELSGELAVH